MIETIKVWMCTGCGRIDHPAPCVGICTDRKAELVHAGDYAQALERVEALEGLLRRIAFTAPRDGEWESGWKAFRKEARVLLAGDR